MSSSSKDLTVVILTFNERLHIERCLKSVSSLTARVVIVDSFSNDETCNIAKQMGAEIYKNEFVNQAQQFQWAMDNCRINTEWVLRLDADETVDSKLVKNIKVFIQIDAEGCNGGIFHRKHIFLGKWIRHGGRYPLSMLRLFRNGKAHVERRWMDEHIVLDEGNSKIVEGGFEDNNLNSIAWFIDKHNKYASREMLDIKLGEITGSQGEKISEGTGIAIRANRILKQAVYMKLPYFIRPLLYFCYRYFLQLGFLDGAKGFSYHFMQGLWYRVLVDLKCLEADRELNKVDGLNEKLMVLERLTGYRLDEYKQ